jgi:hypothetical protein
VIAFGGSGNSTINAGQGSSFIFGHEGEAYYGSAGGPLVFIESLDPTDGTGTTIKVADVAADTNSVLQRKDRLVGIFKGGEVYKLDRAALARRDVRAAE